MPDIQTRTIVLTDYKFNPWRNYEMTRENYTVKGGISPSMVIRLVNYARKRVKELGLEAVLVDDTPIDVEKSEDSNSGVHAYHVSFYTNPYGARIVVQGIETGRGGWPWGDFGVELREK